MAFSNDIAPSASDSKSLLMTHIGGQGSATYLYRRLPPGSDRWFVRYYVKFDPDCYSIHHLSPTIGGYNPSTPYPQGGAGIRPLGNDRFTTQVESGSWSWDFYSYWTGMRHGPDKDATGNFNYWGNNFFKGVTGLSITRGQWICVETMVKSLTNQWNDLSTGIVAAGTFNTTTDPNQPLARTRFYRVIVTPP